MDFPQFNGEDPTGWIYKAEKFFHYQQTENSEKITLASFHLLDDALQWYQWFEKTRTNVSWEKFTHALGVHFGPSDYEDFHEALAKLCQTNTMQEYQANFERLVARVQDWPEKALMGSYIGGLREEIRAEVKLFRPTTLVHATSLARLHEDKLQRLRCPSTQTRPALLPSPQPAKGNIQPPQSSAPRSLQNPTFKKLSWTEMQACRDKGLCYNCDEKFGPGHRCKTQQVFLLEVMGKEGEIDGPTVTIEEEEDSTTTPEISLHALVGVSSPQTIRVTGIINGRPLHILIDSGSTHNFVSLKFAKRMGCCKTASPAFAVMVANGERLTCEEIYLVVPMEIQEYRFQANVYPLDLQGPDVVLGMQWLQGLGRVLHDWSKLTMEFWDKGKKYVICGEDRGRVTQGSTHHVQKLASTNIGAIVMQLLGTAEPTAEESLSQNQAVALKQLLKQYQAIFQIPTTLPPPRSHDHWITLEPGSGPINVRPYRYPHIQKNEIEQAVKEMLTTGII